MYKIVVVILEGWGVILVVKNWKFWGGGGGAYVKFPPWWGMDIFWKYTFSMNKMIAGSILILSTADALYCIYICRNGAIASAVFVRIGLNQ